MTLQGRLFNFSLSFNLQNMVHLHKKKNESAAFWMFCISGYWLNLSNQTPVIKSGSCVVTLTSLSPYALCSIFQCLSKSAKTVTVVHKNPIICSLACRCSKKPEKRKHCEGKAVTRSLTINKSVVIGIDLAL